MPRRARVSLSKGAADFHIRASKARGTTSSQRNAVAFFCHDNSKQAGSDFGSGILRGLVSFPHSRPNGFALHRQARRALFLLLQAHR
jgi:hypothetical protein